MSPSYIGSELKPRNVARRAATKTGGIPPDHGNGFLEAAPRGHYSNVETVRKIVKVMPSGCEEKVFADLDTGSRAEHEDGAAVGEQKGGRVGDGVPADRAREMIGNP